MVGAVWASGRESWYMDDKGNNWTPWPGFTFSFGQLLSKVKIGGFNALPGEDPLETHLSQEEQMQLA
jgi:hypothetical protein